MAEAIRVTKPGGVIMAAYCIAEGTILKYGFGQHNIAQLIGSGQLNPRDFTFRNQPEDVFMMLRKADIDRMMRGFRPSGCTMWQPTGPAISCRICWRISARRNSSCTWPIISRSAKMRIWWALRGTVSMCAEARGLNRKNKNGCKIPRYRSFGIGVKV